MSSINELMEIRHRLITVQQGELRRIAPEAMRIADLMTAIGFSSHLVSAAFGLSAEGEEVVADALRHAKALLNAQEMALRAGDLIEYTPEPWKSPERATAVILRPWNEINVFVVDGGGLVRTRLVNVGAPEFGVELVRRAA